MRKTKTAALDSRVITYRKLPGSSRQYERVNAADCKGYVETRLEIRLGGCGLRLMPSTKDVNGIPTVDKSLIILMFVKDVLHFRIFDGEGKMVVDTNEKKLSGQTREIADLRKQLEKLWPPHELTQSEEDLGIAAVTSIVGHPRINPRKLVVVDTFAVHRGAVEPTLFLAPNGEYLRRIPWHELPSPTTKPPLYIEVTKDFAVKWLWEQGYAVPGGAPPNEAHARIRKRRAPTPEQEYAHKLWYDEYPDQQGIAKQIQTIFHKPFTQSQVSKAIKRVDKYTLGVCTKPTPSRKKRAFAKDPSKIDPKPKSAGGGEHVVRKVVDDYDDDDYDDD